ncbi:MAG: molybdopterin cofactor-binding domain-containing protein [Novosphingobium sp.]
MALTRRGMLVGALAAGGLVVGYVLRPRHFALPWAAGDADDETLFDAWIKVSASGIVSVAVPQLEMGQGITTLIPQIVAQELGADWRQVAVEPVMPNAHHANVPLAARWAELWMPVMSGLADDPDSALAARWARNHAFTGTADGTSLAAYETPARHAAATVRALLAKAAADRWDVDWEECDAAGGFVVHRGKRLSFGDLARAAAGFTPPDPPPLRRAAPRERPRDYPPGARLAFPRLDLPAKVDGAYQFAGDVRLPGMLFAAIRHAPIGDARLTELPAGAAAEVAPVKLVQGRDWLAAVATDWWSAERALAAIQPTFTVRDRAESNRIEAAFDVALRMGDTRTLHAQGDRDFVESRPFALALRYDVAPALHATLETATATARIADGRLELWLASQAPEQARRAAAEALDMGLADVVVYPMPAGGSFDRRLEHDHAIEAALIARDLGKPVQLIWSRWQEHVAGRPRTPVAAVMSAKTAPGGEITAWQARLALPASAREFGARLFDGLSPREAMAAAEGLADPLAMEGALPPYAIPNVVVEHVPVAIPLPTGRLRGNAHGYTAFFTESFIDELAARGRREPLAFRMAMLGNDIRLAMCLQRVSALAGWNGGNDGSGQGLACHRIGNGCIAAVATARRDETGVRVDRISAVADIGRIINVDIARQQVEGGLVYGIGLALGSSTPYAEGLPVNGRLGMLDLPLLADCPTIEVEFIDSEAAPADPGELGVAVAAPAIANALFSATGLRFRRLPLLSEEL